MAKQILGPDGEPVRRELMTRPMAEATTMGVRSPVMGSPADGLNPSRLAAIMKSADQGETTAYFELAEMIEERDLHYTGVLGTRKRSVSQIPIRVERASDAPEHVRHAEMIEAWLKRDVLKKELRDILDAVGKGISFVDIIWDTSEGQWTPKKLEWITQRWFNFDKATLDTPLLREIGGDTPLPWGKVITTRIQSKSGISIRSGIARVASWAWMFKKFTERDWAIFTQTYGQPIRVGKYQDGATADEKNKLLRAVTNIAADCGAIMPAGMDITFVESKTASQSGQSYRERCDWIDQQVSKGVLGQTATTDAIAGGHAVGQEHREVQKDIAEADAGELQSVLNEQLIKVWIDLEFGPQKAYPRLIIEEPEQEDKTLLLEAVRVGVPFGVRIKQSEFREKFGLSEPDPDDEILMAPADRVAAEPPPDEGPKQKQPPPKSKTVPPARQSLHTALAANTLAATTPDVVDELTNLALDDWEEVITPAVKQITEELEAATSLPDFRERLARLTLTVEVADLTEALSNAAVVAHMAGLTGAGLTATKTNG